MYALIDCNNFFVSCEQLFNPKLKGKPVVVLSNNDGVVVSRSQEAKALGIPMGAPAFECRGKDLIMLSSNFSLYSDLSRRVMTVLADFGFPTEIYSVDEAFLELGEEDFPALGKQIREKILQWVGIPTSVGIAPTKTLAKLASEKRGVHVFRTSADADPYLTEIPPEEIWGIGKRTGERLKKRGLTRALAFKQAPRTYIRDLLGVCGERIYSELHGMVAFPLEDSPPLPQSKRCSRTFGNPVATIETLNEAVASFVSSALEDLRFDDLVAGEMTVFLLTKEEFFSAAIALDSPTSHTPDFLKAARQIVSSLFKQGKLYKKAGVIFSNLSSDREVQLGFFAAHSPFGKIVDEINAKMGKKALFYAAEGLEKRWKARAANRSSLPKVKA